VIAYGPIIGGTSSTGSVQNFAVGTAGHLRTSTGAGAAATFQAVSVPAAASQAEQETSTSTTTYVTPGRQQYHPAAAKAWCVFNGTGTPSILASYNVTSITDNGAGDYTINFTTNFSSANYAAVAMGAQGSMAGISTTAAPTASACRVFFKTDDGGGNDGTYCTFIAFGDQ
jgi:hypothetical protein